MKIKRILVLLLSCFLGSAAYLAAAQAESDAVLREDQKIEEERESQTLFPFLEEKGLLLNLALTNDLVSNVSGGLERKTGIIGCADLTLSVDTASLGLWDSGTLFVYEGGLYGVDPSEFVGDYQWTENIEAGNTTKLLEIWYQHEFFEEKVALLFGKYDYSSEFYILDYALALINSSFGTGIDVSQVGPPLWPLNRIALRLSVKPVEQFYLMAGAFDGAPGEAEGKHIKGNGENGFYAVETGIVSLPDAAHYKLAAGAWLHQADFQDFRGIERDYNSGAYVIGESSIIREEDEKQGLGMFFQAGFAHSDRNQIGEYYGVGLNYTGLIPGRDEDVLAAGMALARNGSAYVNANEGTTRTETAWELIYKIKINSYVLISPDVQYVVNPGMDSSIKDAMVLLLRTELVF